MIHRRRLRALAAITLSLMIPLCYSIRNDILIAANRCILEASRSYFRALLRTDVEGVRRIALEQFLASGRGQDDLLLFVTDELLESYKKSTGVVLCVGDVVKDGGAVRIEVRDDLYFVDCCQKGGGIGEGSRFGFYVEDRFWMERVVSYMPDRDFENPTVRQLGHFMYETRKRDGHLVVYIEAAE